MTTANTPSAKSAKSALFIPQPIDADNADNAGEVSVKIKGARDSALALTDKLCEVSMTLAECGYRERSERALRQYFRAVDLFLSVERNLQGLT
jgi:hypothetical protein